MTRSTAERAAATGRRPRALLLSAALLNLAPPGAFALVGFFVISPPLGSLVAGTGSLAAVLCTLYALRLAALRRSLVVLLGAVVVFAGALFLGGDALVRSMPAETLGPGLVPFAGLLLHLCAAVTLFTLGLIHQASRTSARRR